MYGIVVETLRLSLIYQTCFDGTPVFVSEIESLKSPLNLTARDVTKFVALRDNIYKFNSLNKRLYRERVHSFFNQCTLSLYSPIVPM